MRTRGSIIVKRLPEKQGKLHRSQFLGEIKDLVGNTHRPRLIVDFSAEKAMKPETIDLLLECVEEVEHVDGRVSIAAASPEAAVILELTRLTSVLDLFPSMSAALGGTPLQFVPLANSVPDIAA